MDAGLRIDHHTVTGTEWIPQVGLSVQLPQDASLKQWPVKDLNDLTIRELYMFRPANPTCCRNGCGITNYLIHNAYSKVLLLRSQPFLHQRGQYDSDHSHRRTPTERKHRQSRELGSKKPT